MKRRVYLKDGTEVTIRPLKREDLERSFGFFKALPDEDRKYLRVDVTRLENVEKRIRMMRGGKVKRLVAETGEEIIADGALELNGFEWKNGMAELRLIVAHPYQKMGLGRLMARELYSLAAKEHVEEIVVKFMQPQAGAAKIFKNVGFHRDAKLQDYVKDQHGQKHDMIIMRCNLEQMWQKLENYISSSDWQRVR